MPYLVRNADGDVCGEALWPGSDTDTNPVADDHPDLVSWRSAMSAPEPRAMTQNTWCGLADAGGTLSAWLTACDTATRPKDRAYARTGGDAGLYQEGNSKLARLAAAAGIDVAATFDAAGAS